MRLVGAVNVRTGHFDYFDSEKITIRLEHVMASRDTTSSPDARSLCNSTVSTTGTYNH
jgi:hypothetical protein